MSVSLNSSEDVKKVLNIFFEEKNFDIVKMYTNNKEYILFKPNYKKTISFLKDSNTIILNHGDSCTAIVSNEYLFEGIRVKLMK
nr:hypothetical protein [Methanobrevibacter arboriphilus]